MAEEFFDSPLLGRVRKATEEEVEVIAILVDDHNYRVKDSRRRNHRYRASCRVCLSGALRYLRADHERNGHQRSPKGESRSIL